MPGITNPQWDAIRREARKTANAVVREQLPLFKSQVMQATAEVMGKHIAPILQNAARPEMGQSESRLYRAPFDHRTAGVAKVVSDHGFPLSGRTHDHNKKAIQYLKDNESQCMFAVDGVLYVGPKDRSRSWDPPSPSLSPFLADKDGVRDESITNFLRTNSDVSASFVGGKWVFRSKPEYADNYEGPVQVRDTTRPHATVETIQYNELRRILHRNPMKAARSINGVLHIVKLPPPNMINLHFEAFGELSPEVSNAIDKEVDRRVAAKMEKVYNDMFGKNR